MKNKINSNTNYEFQYLDENNIPLKQILKTIETNNKKYNNKNDKLYRNKSALGLRYEDYKDNKGSNLRKRVPTSINETYNTNVRINDKSNINHYLRL